MEEDVITVFCISCGSVSTVRRREILHGTRMVCPKCRYSFHPADRVVEKRTCPLQAGVRMV